MENKGILIINKPQDFTSFDVVAKLRRITGIRRIGHGGTLDPMATGVLPVFLGNATKAVDFAVCREKEYLADFQLGVSTDTQDRTGSVVCRSDKQVNFDQVNERLKSFTGRIAQLPPMYSAVRIHGQHLYELARQGREIPRSKREITISAITLLFFNEKTQAGRFQVQCSKGTYVRTLCHDLGEKLGTYGMMTGLIRTKAGGYTLDQSHTLAEVEQAGRDGLSELLIPVESMFLAYPAVQIDAYGRNRAEHGAFILPEHTDVKEMPTAGTLARIFYEREFVMLGQSQRLNRGGMAWFPYKKF